MKIWIRTWTLCHEETGQPIQSQCNAYIAIETIIMKKMLLQPQQ